MSPNKREVGKPQAHFNSIIHTNPRIEKFLFDDQHGLVKVGQLTTK